jgi:cell division ATPase FtsA
MRTIIDIGSRFIKVIITENNQILGKNIQTSEGIKNGLINDSERLSESIFEAIEASMQQSLNNNEISFKDLLQNIHITTSIGHCYIENVIDHNHLPDKNNTTLQIAAGDDSEEEIDVWMKKYMIGDLYIDNPIAINKEIKHQKISIKMQKECQLILRKIFENNNAVVKSILFNNCKRISEHSEIRVDVGYCSTRVFNYNNIQIIPVGLYNLIKEISNTYGLPLRQTERILQISNRHNDFVNSMQITKTCQKFIIDLFAKIINQQNKINDNSYFVLQGGINSIPFVPDFIESKFAIRTHPYKTYQYDDMDNPEPYVNCLSIQAKLENSEII